MSLTWGVLRAMERSHSWNVFRNLRGSENRRRCGSCGDDDASEIRYCPGTPPEPANG